MSEQFSESRNAGFESSEEETEQTPSEPSPEAILEALTQAERLRRLGYGWQ
ncbi:MAG: hypothetical protein IK127_02020 [Clostridia bacterium]|nr:hypothetical protein [Clostridia bacterium]